MKTDLLELVILVVVLINLQVVQLKWLHEEVNILLIISIKHL